MTSFDHDARRRELISARSRELRRGLEQSLDGYRATQTALAVHYGVAGVDPAPYSEATRAVIRERAEQCTEPWDFAWTSGTTSEPKQILYPASRQRSLADHFVDQVVLAADAYGVASPRFYFLTSFTADRSLSALVAATRPTSAVAEELLGDYFALRHAAVTLAPRYSSLALSWALIWSLRPTIVTTVNPSSLCMLLRHGLATWPTLREQVRRILEEDCWQSASRSAALSTTRSEILDWLTAKTNSPTPAQMLPHVELVNCWQGGYVRPFVDQLRDLLLPRQPHLVPMFSLSTEVIATSVFPHVSRDAGLPIYPGCCYEFLPQDAEPDSDNVLRPWQLVAGEAYRMVVSDAYGLLRYDTQDLFRCVGHAGDAPLIEFLRRHGLNYSFTGEKLTDCQLQEAYGEVARTNGLVGSAWTCFPRQNSGSLPGYVFVMLAADGKVDCEQTAKRLDIVLCRINLEYASKRQTDRLAAPSVVTMPAEMLIAKLAEALPRTAAANPGQFKLLPLYTLMWEDLMSGTKDFA